jgi:hypothetical protein
VATNFDMHWCPPFRDRVIVWQNYVVAQCRAQPSHSGAAPSPLVTEAKVSQLFGRRHEFCQLVGVDLAGSKIVQILRGVYSLIERQFGHGSVVMEM